MRQLTVATLTVFLLGAVGIFAVPLPPPEAYYVQEEEPVQVQPPIASEPAWTVVFQFKKDNGIGRPVEPVGVCRLYLLVSAKTEGEAAIRAHKYLNERIAIAAMDSLEYQEAQQKK